MYVETNRRLRDALRSLRDLCEERNDPAPFTEGMQRLLDRLEAELPQRDRDAELV